jgi:hypothetical protein
MEYLESDIPVACTASGAIYVLDRVIEGTVDTVVTIRGKMLRREIDHYVGRPCSHCRFQTSREVGPEKLSTCRWRLLNGPLFVPR